MHRLSSSGMVYHGGVGWLSVGRVASGIGGVVGLLSVHDPKWWSFRLLSNGDYEFWVVGDTLEVGYH